MNEISIDDLDLKLLEQLQEDASLGNHELARRCHTSAPTALRRVKRLQETGIIEKQLAVLNPERLAAVLGHGLTAVVEVTLERQDAAALDQFEQRAVQEPAITQCYRVSPGPDFVLIAQVQDMPSYHALTQRLLHSDSHVRNVKAFFSIKRSKFGAALPLRAGAGL